MQIEQMHYNFDLLYDRVASNDRPHLPPWIKDEFLNMAIMMFIKTRYNSDKSVFTDKSLLLNTLGFESNQKRIDELASLHIKSPELQPSITPVIVGDGLYEFRLDDLGNNINGQYFRYLFLTKMYVKAIKNNCRKYIEIKQWQIDDIKTSFDAASWKWNRVLANFGKSTIQTPSLQLSNLNTPSFHLNLRTGSGNSLQYKNEVLKSIYIDTKNSKGIPEFEIESGDISYIKYPNRVTLGQQAHIDNMNPTSLTPIHLDIDDAFHDEIVRIAVELAQASIQDQVGYQLSDKQVKDDFTA